MKRKLLIVYILIVLAPLVVVGWLGIALARNEQQMVRVHLNDVLAGRLTDVNATISAFLEKRERELMAQGTLSTLSPDELRARARASGIVRQYFVLDKKSDLVFPPPAGDLTASEEEFLNRTQSVWRNGEIPTAFDESQSSESLVRTANTFRPPQGWHASYWGSGITLLFWWRESTGNIVGAELNEARLMADIIGILPEATPNMPRDKSPLPDGRIELVDSKGSVVYQWGGFAGTNNKIPPVTRSVSPPLGSWSLVYYTPDDAAGTAFGKSVAFNVLSGVGALSIALIGLAAYFYRENARNMREAQQRVTFVNQVSHELKTPLTNIRIYAEMLDDELADSNDLAKRRLSVIVSESQRLSRLIGNVLTFSRNQRSAQQLHKSAGNIDDALRGVLQSFEASLSARDIHAEFIAGANHEAEFDRDSLEQIVGNLVSNVEKYAATGGHLRVESRQTSDAVTIIVADDGPGIPQHLHERVFEPFFRVSDELTDGVAGAGFGLTIARELARLHGGDLTLQPSNHGARFNVVIAARLIGTEKPT